MIPEVVPGQTFLQAVWCMTHVNFHRKFNNLLPVFTLKKVRASIELQPGVPY